MDHIILYIKEYLDNRGMLCQLINPNWIAIYNTDLDLIAIIEISQSFTVELSGGGNKFSLHANDPALLPQLLDIIGQLNNQHIDTIRQLNDKKIRQ